jgi:hypothetical protein
MIPENALRFENRCPSSNPKYSVCCLPSIGRIVLVAWLIFTLVDLFTCSNVAWSDEVREANALDVHVLANADGQLKTVGAKSCGLCHGRTRAVDALVEEQTEFVRLSEASRWKQFDKHHVAYDLVRIDLEAPKFDLPEHVSNKRARDMVIKLGWTQGDGNFEHRCLTCHAGLDRDADLSNKAILNSVLLEGVQCEACHGPGEKYTQLTEHPQSTWRAKSIEEKQALGLKDLSNSVVTAEVCLSCHLGELSSGRFVTHDMYAAGHPPLPPFDLQTFLDAMPPHWGKVEGENEDRRRGPAIQEKPTWAANGADRPFQFQREYLLKHFEIDPSKSDVEIREEVQRSFERSKRSMVGAMVAQDTSLQLLHDAADQPAVWGDYALFDCMGCHQTLFKDRSRYRAPGRVPGRPFPPTWLTVSDTLTGELLPTDPIRAKVDDAFNRVPFGDRDRFKAESASLTKFLEERRKLAYEWSKQVVDAADTKEWVALLIEEQSPKLSDYWVAKQTAWMVQVAVGELVDKKQLDASAVAEDLEALDRILLLKLQIPQRESVLKEQMSTLETARSFDANQVRKHLESIRSALL